MGIARVEFQKVLPCELFRAWPYVLIGLLFQRQHCHTTSHVYGVRGLLSSASSDQSFEFLPSMPCESHCIITSI